MSDVLSRLLFPVTNRLPDISVYPVFFFWKGGKTISFVLIKKEVRGYINKSKDPQLFFKISPKAKGIFI